jgi:hypothetical protein
MIPILPVIICFLGIYCGVAVGKIAEEELKDGRKYFIILENVIFSLIVFFTVVQVSQSIPFAILGLIAGYALMKIMKIKHTYKTSITYFIFGFLLIYGMNAFLTDSTKLIYPAIVTLVFLYGFPAGSIRLHDRNNLFLPGLYGLPLIIVGGILLLV